MCQATPEKRAKSAPDSAESGAFSRLLACFPILARFVQSSQEAACDKERKELMNILNKLGLVLLTAAALTAPQTARADINGFGDGIGFTVNAVSVTPTVGGGVFQPTDGHQYSASSIYFDTPQNITSWTADFTYQDLSGKGSDGFAFVLQNQGLTALGSNGRGLGYAGTAPSAAIAFNIAEDYVKGTRFVTGGADPSQAGGFYPTTDPVDLASTDPIGIHLSYDGTTLFETLTDGAKVYQTSYTTDLEGVLGGPTAYIGFSGATGQNVSTQQISGFQFRNSPAPVPEASTTVSMGLLMTLGAGGLLLARRKRAVRA